MWKRVTSVKKIDATRNSESVPIENMGAPLSGLEKPEVPDSTAYTMSQQTSEHLLSSIFCGLQAQHPQKNTSRGRINREKSQLQSWLKQMSSTSESGCFSKLQKNSG